MNPASVDRTFMQFSMGRSNVEMSCNFRCKVRTYQNKQKYQDQTKQNKTKQKNRDLCMYIWIDFGLILEKDDDSDDDDKDDDTSLESCLAVKRWLKFADFSLELVRFLLLCSYMARNNKTNEDNGNRSNYSKARGCFLRRGKYDTVQATGTFATHPFF